MGYEGREATGYDHGYEAEVFYFGPALDSGYIEGFGEDGLERERVPGGEWEEGDRGTALEVLKSEVEVRAERSAGF